MIENQFTILIIIILILYWLYLYKKFYAEYFENDELPNHIWLYWETKKGKKKPAYLDLCYETIVKHCGNNFKIHLLDENTVYDYLPNLRKDFNNKITKIPMKADYIRYQLLYKYGGIWLDSDVIVFKNLYKLLEKLKDYEYVGFGCHYIGKQCTEKNDGYSKPANWVMICRPNSLLMKTVIKKADILLKSNDKEYFDKHYHILGRNLLWDCIQELKSKYKSWDYLHVSSKCVERDSSGKKITNERSMSIESIDEYCNKKRYFLPIYNSAPGFPKWFLDMTKKEILNNNILISKYLQTALSDA